jgi:hypothetical protein
VFPPLKLCRGEDYSRGTFFRVGSRIFEWSVHPMREVTPRPPVDSPGPPSLVNALAALIIAVSLVATWAVLCAV